MIRAVAVLISLTILISNTSLADTKSRVSKEIRLGATIPLTGDFATYGNLIRDGIRLAQEDLKKQGYKVKVYYEDVNMPGAGAVTAIRNLVHAKKIQGLAANFLNPAIPPMAPTINRNKIIAFHTAAADDLILGAGDYIFSTNAKIRDEAVRIAEYTYNDLEARTACVLYINTTFGENYSMHFIRRFEELGGRILYNDTTEIGQTDLRAVLTKVERKDPDVFFAAYFGTNLGVVLKQARQLGLSKPILGVYESEDPSVIETGLEGAEDLLFFVPEPKVDNPKRRQFVARFTETYGYTPRVLATNAYDATKILVKALSVCDLNPECARDRIYKISNHEGTSGIFSIEKDGGARKEFVLKTVKDQKFIRVR